MKKYTEEISDKLNELLIKNYDAEKGYQNAAENVDSDRLKMFLKEDLQSVANLLKSLKTKSYNMVKNQKILEVLKERCTETG